MARTKEEVSLDRMLGLFWMMFFFLAYQFFLAKHDKETGQIGQCARLSNREDSKRRVVGYFCCRNFGELAEQKGNALCMSSREFILAFVLQHQWLAAYSAGRQATDGGRGSRQRSIATARGATLGNTASAGHGGRDQGGRPVHRRVHDSHRCVLVGGQTLH